MPNTQYSTFNTHTQHLTPNTQHLTLNTKQSTPNEVTFCLMLVWSDVLIHSVVKSHWRQSYCKQRRSQTTTTISLYSGDNECPNITNSSGHMASNKDKETDNVFFFHSKRNINNISFLFRKEFQSLGESPFASSFMDLFFCPISSSYSVLMLKNLENRRSSLI